MKYERLLEFLGNQGFFDLASVVQLVGGRRESIRMQLYRWCKTGKLRQVRRGMYAFSKNYGRVEVNPAELANHLYAPSYISTHWALGYWGLIPERVVTYTSVTPRAPANFINDFGTFKYRHIKPSGFFGYSAQQIAGGKIYLADAEKALIDLWHLDKGLWDRDRMSAMRFQNFESVGVDKLQSYATRFKSPRISAAVRVWLDVKRAETEGTEEL
jgi:predicted transcriptional regulator of viral defense system